MPVRNYLKDTVHVRQVYVPAARAEATVSSDDFDATTVAQAVSGLLLLDLGATANTPTGLAGTIVGYDKDESADSYAAASPAVSFPFVLTDANSVLAFQFDPMAFKRHRSWQVALDFTGGSSPTIVYGLIEVLGGLAKNP